MNIADTSVRLSPSTCVDERLRPRRVEEGVVADVAEVDVVLEAGVGVADRLVAERAASVVTSVNCGQLGERRAARASARACCSAVTSATPEKSIGAVGSHGRGHVTAVGLVAVVGGRRSDVSGVVVVAAASSAWAWSVVAGSDVWAWSSTAAASSAWAWSPPASSWLCTLVAPAIMATTLRAPRATPGDDEVATQHSRGVPGEGHDGRHGGERAEHGACRVGEGG